MTKKEQHFCDLYTTRGELFCDEAGSYKKAFGSDEGYEAVQLQAEGLLARQYIRNAIFSNLTSTGALREFFDRQLFNLTIQQDSPEAKAIALSKAISAERAVKVKAKAGEKPTSKRKHQWKD